MNNSLEYQQVVIGLIFQYENLNDKIVNVNEEDFETPFKEIYQNMRLVYNDYGSIDKVKVLSKLDGDEKIILVRACEFAITPSMIDDYIECLKKESSKRRVANKLNELILVDDCTTANVQKIIDDEESKSDLGTTESKAIANAENFIDELLVEKKLIKTGFESIDLAIHGLERGTLFIIGARPSVGKTTFALNIVRNQMKQNRKSLVFSLEMTANMIYERMMSDILNIDYTNFSRKNALINVVKKIENQMSTLKDIVLVLDDVYTVENICARIMEVKPDIVVVDFLQNVQTAKHFNDERMKINHISAELKRTAKKTGTVVIALSQMTRTGKDAPTMSDLRESGVLEQDGDYIMILHRPYVIDKSIGDETTTDLLFDKNKFGWTGKLQFNFDGRHQRFTGVFIE